MYSNRSSIFQITKGQEECVLCICRHREVLQKPIVCILMDQFYANFMFDFDIKNQTIKNK